MRGRVNAIRTFKGLVADLRVKWHQSRRERKYWFQATKCKINYWHQFSEAISKLAIVAGIITIITKGINK